MSLKKNGAEGPVIDSVLPPAAIPGGDFILRGHGFVHQQRPIVTMADQPAQLVVSSDTYIVARVPDNAHGCTLIIDNGEQASPIVDVAIGVALADTMHPVTSPAVDDAGNIYTTFSGSRGQKTPVAIYRVEPGGGISPYLTEMMNATALAFDARGVLHASSRYEGIVYQITARDTMSVFVEGMGVATGLAFDRLGNLYVGDRSGTIFKISPQRQIYVFATMEPSIAAYHLAFGPDDYLYVSGPTTSSFDAVHRVAPTGEVEEFYRGLGRPQGLAFDVAGNLYVASSLAGRKGIVKITQAREASLYLSGPNIVGLAFTPQRQLAVTTTSALFRVDAGVTGRPLP
jgi:sugar lactone lactonase YvrE